LKSAHFVPGTDDAEIYSCAADGKVRHSNVLLNSRRSWNCNSGMVHKICLNPDIPHVFYSCCEDGFVRFYDVRENHACSEYGVCTATSLVRDPGNELNSIAVNPVHPVHFVTAGNDKVVRLYDVRYLKPGAKKSLGLTVAEYRASDPGTRFSGITGVAYSRDGSEIVATYSGGNVFLFDAASPETGGTEFDIPDFVKKTEEELTHLEEVDHSSEPEAASYRSLTQWKLRWLRSRVNNLNESKNENGEVDDEDFLDEDENPVYIPERNSYAGHINVRTVKEVNFYGPNSEYVISGSDDGRLYIWRKKDAKLVQVLQGDDDVVNCIQGHPNSFDLIASGIDNTVKVYQPIAERPKTSEEIEEMLNAQQGIMAGRRRRRVPIEFLLALYSQLSNDTGDDSSGESEQEPRNASDDEDEDGEEEDEGIHVGEDVVHSTIDEDEDMDQEDEEPNMEIG
jgi:WD repeat-containing protein 42A